MSEHYFLSNLICLINFGFTVTFFLRSVSSPTPVSRNGKNNIMLICYYTTVVYVGLPGRVHVLDWEIGLLKATLLMEVPLMKSN